jgi:uncharacterized protein
MTKAAIEIPIERIASLCRKWRVRELSLFGSVLSHEFRPDSDVDILVEFESDAPWSLFDLVEMNEELHLIFGRAIDLVEKAGLKNPFRRHAILNSREVVYAA